MRNVRLTIQMLTPPVLWNWILTFAVVFSTKFPAEIWKTRNGLLTLGRGFSSSFYANNKSTTARVVLLLLAESKGLEPSGLLHLTRFPGELLSHSVNSPKQANY